MSRVKLTEYKAKLLLFKELNLPYSGIGVTSADTSAILKVSNSKQYVVKVDQGIKKRMKNGLVKLNVKSTELKLAISELAKKGYEQFIIEEMLPHEPSQEKYLAIERTREGYFFIFK
jgi:succinyl-CoA synthetase beta subunit